MAYCKGLLLIGADLKYEGRVTQNITTAEFTNTLDPNEMVHIELSRQELQSLWLSLINFNKFFVWKTDMKFGYRFLLLSC